MNLEDLRISVSPDYERVFIGTASKSDPQAWESKIECTSAFLSVLMHWAPPGTLRPIFDESGNEYHLQITKVDGGQVKWMDQGEKPT